MSDLTQRMVDDIKVDIPMLASNTVKRYFDEVVRDFFYYSKRHRTTIDDFSGSLLSRQTSKDIELVADGATTDGSSLWTIDRNSNVITEVSFSNRDFIKSITIVGNPSGITHINGFLLIVDDNDNSLTSYNLAGVSTARATTVSNPSGVAVIGNNVYVGTNDAFINKIYVHSQINLEKIAEIDVGSRISTITNIGDKLYVITGVGPTFSSPKLKIYSVDGTTILLKNEYSINQNSAPTSAFSYDGIIYLGNGLRFDAYLLNSTFKAPVNFEFVCVEKVQYIHPDTGDKVRISDTKDDFRNDDKSEIEEKTLSYYQPTIDEIIFTYEVRGKVQAQVSLCPTSHEYIPDYIIRNYWNGIKSGIMAKLLLLPQEWANSELSIFNLNAYNKCKNEAKDYYMSNLDVHRPPMKPYGTGLPETKVVFK